MLPVIAILGRPNVGKSTLFNRLIGERKAIVDDRPGVTRDRNYGTAEYADREFIVIDTGGLDPEPGDDLFGAIRRQAEAALAEADVVVLVVDRQVGLMPADKVAVDLLRRWWSQYKGAGQPALVLAVNKCDGNRHDDEAYEFHALGIDPLVPISAEHGRGILDLWDEILAFLPEAEPTEEVDDEASFDEEPPDEVDEEGGWSSGEAEGEGEGDDGAAEAPPAGEIRIAVIGRPNLGKSTLVNRLLGEERQVVHDAPGTTMDAIDSLLVTPARTWRIVDTAGVRRRARIDDHLESFATARAIRTIERCHIILFVVDALEGPTGQDARLASLVVDRGRAAIVLINRWDLVKDDPERNSRVVEDELRRKLPHLDWAPRLYISALTGKGCARILPLAEEVYASFNRRVPTARLNRFLADAVLAHSPPQRFNHPVKINYITQTRVRPPSFVAWSNTPEGVAESYRRYLENRLRETFGYVGTPLKLDVRKKRKPGEAKIEDDSP